MHIGVHVYNATAQRSKSLPCVIYNSTASYL